MTNINMFMKQDFKQAIKSYQTFRPYSDRKSKSMTNRRSDLGLKNFDRLDLGLTNPNSA